MFQPLMLLVFKHYQYGSPIISFTPQFPKDNSVIFQLISSLPDGKKDDYNIAGNIPANAVPRYLIPHARFCLQESFDLNQKISPALMPL